MADEEPFASLRSGVNSGRIRQNVSMAVIDRGEGRKGTKFVCSEEVVLNRYYGSLESGGTGWRTPARVKESESRFLDAWSGPFFLAAPLWAAIGSRKRLIRPEHELVVKKESWPLMRSTRSLIGASRPPFLDLSRSDDASSARTAAFLDEKGSISATCAADSSKIFSEMRGVDFRTHHHRRCEM